MLNRRVIYRERERGGGDKVDQSGSHSPAAVDGLGRVDLNKKY